MRKSNRGKLTQERLKELFSYDQKTGVFKRKIPRGNQSLSAIPGTKLHPSGRKYMHVDGCTYFSYRLAWLYVYGRFPINEIDHIDGNKGNDSIDNLREATRKINAQNKRTPMANNKSGYLGVNKRGNRYRARIRVDGKLINIGHFLTPQEAHEAYMRKKTELHPGMITIL